MSDYTVGGQLLRTRRAQDLVRQSKATAEAISESEPQDGFSCTASLAEDWRGYLREIATRPPAPTRLTEASSGPIN